MSAERNGTGRALVAANNGRALVLSGNALHESDRRELVTMTIAGQLFGIPVLDVQDVLGPQSITRIPLAPNWVAGALNLRGRIVTAIDVRLRLGLERRMESTAGMSIVVENKGELYSLVVDEVGEVLSVQAGEIEPNPATLDPSWREVSAGIVRLDDRLLVVMDVTRLFICNAEAA